ncbi:hypothetical protein DFH09DRAFT_1315063 [Mycena vulgaris]|nr:hypothetical protein DFH09DRAFT_1315063 [Mycena vulgaris]
MRLMAEIHGQIEPFALHPRGLHTLTALVQRTNLRPTSRTPRAFHHRRAPRLALAGSVISCALSTTAVVLVGLPRLGPSPCTVSHRRSARSAPAASRRALADLPSAQIDVLRAACLPGALCLHGAVVPPASPAPRCRHASTRAASALRYTHSALEYPLLLPDPALAFLPLPPLRGATPAFASAPRDPTARPAPAHAIALANVHLASHARIYARGRPLHAPRAQLPLGSLEIGARATPCPTSPKIGASHLSTRQGGFPRGCEGGRPLRVLAVVSATTDPVEWSLPLRGWPFPPLVAIHALLIPAQAPDGRLYVQPLTTTRGLPRTVLSLPV